MCHKMNCNVANCNICLMINTALQFVENMNYAIIHTPVLIAIIHFCYIITTKLTLIFKGSLVILKVQLNE